VNSNVLENSENKKNHTFCTHGNKETIKLDIAEAR